MKKVILLVVVVSLVGWLTGCATSKSLDQFGGGGGGGSLTSGNYSLIATGGVNGSIWFGGNLNASGANVTGNLFAFGAGSCFTLGPTTAPMAITGTISAGTLTMSGTLSGGQTVTFTLTLPTSSTSILTGSYAITAGNTTCEAGDTGSITSTLASSVAGTWSGTSDASSGVLTTTFAEAGTASANGSYLLSGSGTNYVTFTGVTGCTVTGTFNTSANDSFTAGSIVFMDINTVDNGVAGDLLLAGLVDSPTTPANLTVSYLYQGGSGCFFNNSNQGNGTGIGSFNMTKQ